MGPCVPDKTLILEREKKGKGEKVWKRQEDRQRANKSAKSRLLRTSRLHNLRQERECGGKRRGERAIGEREGCSEEKRGIVFEETSGFD